MIPKHAGTTVVTAGTGCERVRTRVTAAIITRDPIGNENGYLVPLYNEKDGFYSENNGPQQVYLTVVRSHMSKGPHLHLKRRGFFTCIKGSVKIILKLENGEYTEFRSGPRYGYRSVEVPEGVGVLIVNPGKEDAFVLNMPRPGWDPDAHDEHMADFSDRYVGATNRPPRQRSSLILRCRVCRGSHFTPVLDLGMMPPANSFLLRDEALRPEMFPLKLCLCDSCGLLQLREKVRPNLLYRHYDYMTSASGPLAVYFAEFAKELVGRFQLLEHDLVVEIGGNDGTFLNAIRGNSRTLNIDPAQRLVEKCNARGVPALKAYFSRALGAKVRREAGPAKIVTASNVLAHIDDLRGVFAGVRSLLAEDGVFVAEVHWVGNLIGDGGFDQIYHEHLSYFSLKTFSRLATDEGLPVFDAKLTPMHGTLLRVFMARNRPVERSVGDLLQRERRLGLGAIETYRSFALAVQAVQTEFSRLIRQLRGAGMRIAGYGAPAKANTLINSCGLDHRSIEYIVDTTPFKQGLYTPLSGIPVVPPQRFADDPPDYAVIFAWNYAETIIRREATFVARGGKFILPHPTPRIVDGAHDL